MLTMLFLISTADARKPKAPPPPPVGWGKEEGWTGGDCYFPKDWAAMQEGDRRMYRAEVMNELKSQWSGARNDGVTIDPSVVEAVENVLMAKPQAIENVAATNLEQCRALRKGGGDAALAAWEGWLRGLPAQLTKGDCTRPLTYTLFNYLDIGSGWQQPVVMCKDNRARLSATTADKYRTSDKSPWHTVEGDTAAGVTSDPQFPCTGNERCYPGTLIGRFVTDDGVEVVFPIGAETTFRAPENGQLYISINDYTWYDNRYFKSSTIEDRVAVTIEPAP